MLEIFEDRHGARSTILTSQLPVENWHDYVANPTIADALLDRVTHNTRRIKLKGPRAGRPGAETSTKSKPATTKSVASLRLGGHDADPSDHDDEILVITMGGMRN